MVFGRFRHAERPATRRASRERGDDRDEPEAGEQRPRATRRTIRSGTRRSIQRPARTASAATLASAAQCADRDRDRLAGRACDARRRELRQVPELGEAEHRRRCATPPAGTTGRSTRARRRPRPHRRARARRPRATGGTRRRGTGSPTPTRDGRSGRRSRNEPTVTASTTCPANAATAPTHTASGRRNRVVSTSVANIVLSGSSARNTAPNAARSAAITRAGEALDASRVAVVLAQHLVELRDGRLGPRRRRPGPRRPCTTPTSARSAATPRPGRRARRRTSGRSASRRRGRRRHRARARRARPSRPRQPAPPSVAHSSAMRAVPAAAPSRSLASSIAWRASSHSDALSADDEPSTPRPTCTPAARSGDDRRDARRQDQVAARAVRDADARRAEASDLVRVRHHAVRDPRAVGRTSRCARGTPSAGSRTSPARTRRPRRSRRSGCAGGRRAARPARPSAPSGPR